MANTIKHQGIVENINGSHLQVRIIQTSACASCSVKGHCTSADTKEKLVDVADANAASYQRRPCMGDGRTFNGSDGSSVCLYISFPYSDNLTICLYGYLE